MEEVDESIAEFEGRVQIVIDDTEQDIQHSIVADKVNFNRTLNSVTALGNVEYIKTEKAKPELVTAESLTFNLSNWKGSMLKCISRQDKTIGEEQMVFYYVTGEIKKSDTEVMGMNDVTIQTVEGSPYFNISALDLWMLDSSDFVIIVPTIKVGNVPVFISPFYYHTDNNLYFNPVYGIRSREGTVFQNTLYLMGNKPKNEDESDFSFLSFDNGEGSGNMELNGLTLVPSDDKESYNSDYSKMMLDYYSNLGIFIGNNTKFNFSNLKTKIEWDGGFGFSRNIDDSNGTVFTNGESDWNSSYIFDTKVPYRYMLNFSVDSPIVDIDFKSYSDIYFKTDFYNREENFKWIDYFTEQLDDGIETLNSNTEESYQRDTDTISSITSYDIGVDFTKISPDVKVLNPFVSNFSFDIKEMTIDYSSKISKYYSDTDDDTKLESIYEDFDPAYKFFYPETLTVPLTMTLSGKLFDTTYEKSTVDENKDNKDKYVYENKLFQIENPILESEKNSEETSDVVEKSINELEKIETDSLFGDIKIKKSKNDGLIWTNLAYSIKTPLNIYGYWDDDDWNNSEDIVYDLADDDILYNFDPTGTLTYSLGLLNSFFTIKDVLEGNIYKKSYLEDDQQDNLYDVYSWNKTLLENDLTLKFDIFKLFPNIDNHSFSVSYDLDTLLYKKSFDKDKYEENGSLDPYYLVENFDWTDDYVNDNEITSKYEFDIDFSKTAIEYKKVLPPFDDEDNIKLDQTFKYDIFSFFNNKSLTSLEYNRTIKTDDDVDDELIEVYSASETYSISIAKTDFIIDTGFDYSESYLDDEDDEWDFSPLKLSLEFKPIDFITLKLGSLYSFEDEQWSEYSGSLTLGDLKLQMVSSYDQPIEWDTDDQSWSTVSDSDDILKFDSLIITHNLELKSYTFWKNRITLDIDSDLSITKEFIEVDQSSMKYSLDFSLDIYDFLSFELKTTSKNSTMYQYFESDYKELGLNTGKDLFTDLIKSFNLFSESDREYSSFNIYKIELDATYKMPDWNLIFNYTGNPLLEDDEYTWYQTFSFFIEWKPLSLVRSKVLNDDSDWTVSTSSTDE